MRRLFTGCWLLLLLVAVPALAQNFTIRGQVTSSTDNAGLPGVTVQAKGTTRGVTTDATGNYQISVPSGTILIFSGIGFTPQEIPVGSESVINVKLSDDTKVLNEVVVTAIGFEREKKNLGYAVNTVSNTELTIGRNTNVVNSLQGKVAGVRIQSSSGQVGSSSAIFIRGFTTFTGSNQPLFVVDGIPIDNSGGGTALQNGVANSNRGIDLNQDEIENLTVLKGPAAAALYGSRAASGAIIVTTKKGRRNTKTTVQVTSSYNVSEANRFPDWQNEYAQGLGGNFNPISNQSWGPQIRGQRVPLPASITAAQRRELGLGDSTTLTAYPNNVRDIFRQGNNFQKNVAFTAGNDRSTFRVSFGNLVENGILQNNKLVRNNFRFNGSSQVTSKFTAGVNAEYITSSSSRTQIGNQLSNPFFRTWFLPRNINLQGIPSQDAAGNQVYYDTQDNPYWTLNNNRWNDQVNRLLANVNLNYDITSWMSANYRIGVDNYTQTINAYDQIGARGAATASAQGAGGIRNDINQTKNISSFLNLNVKRQINEDLGFNLTLGNEVTQLYSSLDRITGTRLNIRDFNNIANANTYVPVNIKETQRLIGAYADLSVSYKQWLTVNFTGRNDWSSTFGRAKRSFFYPTVAASFVFTEAFPSIKNGNIISFGKLYANRARGGKVAPVYSTDTYFLQANPVDGFGPQIQFPFQGQGGQTLDNAAGNPDLGPEFTTSSEVGLEMSFLRDRIGLEFAYFNQLSTDLIFAVPISPGSGYTNLTRNAGELRSKGVEVLLRGTAIRNERGSWNITANFSHVDPRVVQLAPNVPVIFLGGFTTPNARLEAGAPYGVLYGSVFNRDAQGRLLINNPTLPNGNPNPLAGQTSLSSTIARIGNPNPQWTMGITNDIAYRGFNLSFLIDIRKGGQAFSRNTGDLRRSGAAAETAEFPRFNADGTPNRPYIIEGVLADGTPNTTRLTAEQYWGNLYAFGTGESYVFDTSWLRIREASLSYTLPTRLLNKTPFGQLQLGVNGRNLFLYAPNFPHFDPENNALGASNAQGLEFNGLPQTRSYGVFLKTSF